MHYFFNFKYAYTTAAPAPTVRAVFIPSFFKLKWFRSNSPPSPTEICNLTNNKEICLRNYRIALSRNICISRDDIQVFILIAFKRGNFLLPFYMN